MNYKISILIPCYNAEQWIAETIESALNQTYPHKELIVVDDGSTDGSLEIIKTFGDRIRWESGSNRGGNAARNRLLELSTGEWLQYLDADDYLLADKIEKQVKFLSTVPNADIIYSPVIVEYQEINYSWQKLYPLPEPHDPWILLAKWYMPQTGSPLWRKQAIIDVGGWKIDQPCCQEHELYLRLLITGKQFNYLNTPGSVYRWRNDSTVCKKDIRETYRRRLEIKDEIEQYLARTGKLTQLRREAINQTRFNCARMIWQFDQKWANNILLKILNSQPQFKPSNHQSLFYRIGYNIFGFKGTEIIADMKRGLTRKTN